MLLQDSQGRFPKLSKNRHHINIPIVGDRNTKRNMQQVSQCYAGGNLGNLLHKSSCNIEKNRGKNNLMKYIVFRNFIQGGSSKH